MTLYIQILTFIAEISITLGLLPYAFFVFKRWQTKTQRQHVYLDTVALWSAVLRHCEKFIEYVGVGNIGINSRIHKEIDLAIETLNNYEERYVLRILTQQSQIDPIDMDFIQQSLEHLRYHILAFQTLSIAVKKSVETSSVSKGIIVSNDTVDRFFRRIEMSFDLISKSRKKFPIRVWHDKDKGYNYVGAKKGRYLYFRDDLAILSKTISDNFSTIANHALKSESADMGEGLKLWEAEKYPTIYL